MQLATRSSLLLAAFTLLTPVVAHAAATVTLTGELTSFKSALSAYATDGDGTLNGTPLLIDATLPKVQYSDGDSTQYPQSQTVALPGGTSSVQFEYTSGITSDAPNPNRISFTAAGPSNVNVGDVFKVGTLSFTNGFWYPYASVGLTIQTHSLDPALNNMTFVGNINVKVSSPVPFYPEPESNADYIYLSDASGPLTALGSARVYEKAFQPAGNPGNEGSVDLYARIGSLIPVRFGNPSPGIFLSTSLDPMTTPAVPEPSAWLMVISGVALVGAKASRRGQFVSKIYTAPDDEMIEASGYQ
jgi:hypothetical protein